MQIIQHKQSLGFTLIELLVTVTIVGILAAMAISFFDEYKGKANDSLAQSQIRSMATAFNASLVDRDPTEMNDDRGQSTIGFNPDGGTTTFHTTLTIEQLLPGFIHQLGVQIWMHFYYDNLLIYATHCQGSLVRGLYGRQQTTHFHLPFFGSSILTLPPLEIWSLPANGAGC